MAFSAATNISNSQENLRLERVLSAYQDAIDNPKQEETESEVSELIKRSGSPTEFYDSSNGSRERSEGDSGSQQICGRFANFPWQPIKFATFYFLTGGAPAMLLPYLSVYYRQLGLDPNQIGIVKSLQPWVAIPAIPLWGCLADRLNITRLMLMISLVGYLVSNVVLAIIPNVDEVDCSTAISRICQHSKSVATYEINPQQPLLSSSETATVMDSSTEEVATWNDMTTYGNSSNQVCRPSSQYMGYFYDSNDIQQLYVYFIIINIVGEIWQAPTPALGNAAVLNSLGKKKRNQYGYYKAVGAVAAAIGVFVAGLAVDNTEEIYMHCGLELIRANYAVCFIGFAVCVLLVIPIAWNLHGPEEVHAKPREYHFREVVSSLFNIRYGSAFLAITWLSIAVGVAKSFDYWYIETLGGSHSVMAWTGMLGTLILIITFLSLPYLNDRFGHLPFLVLALFVTGVGCAVSAFIQNPWWMTLPMCLRGIATATSAQSSGAYLANAVNPHHMATLQTIMAAIIFGVGNGTGSVLGGILIKAWSPFICYAVFAIASFIFSGILIVAQLSSLQDSTKAQD